MIPTPDARRSEITALCRRFHVHRLDVFGSAARAADFDPGRSGIDLLVTYRPGHAPTIGAHLALRAARCACRAVGPAGRSHHGRGGREPLHPRRDRAVEADALCSMIRARIFGDVREAADRVAAFLQGRDLAAYPSDPLRRSAVERQLETVGEALHRLSRAAPELASRIPDLRCAVGMRNVLIHGYAQVDNEAVWRTASDDLPTLRAEVAALLAELGETP